MHYNYKLFINNHKYEADRRHSEGPAVRTSDRNQTGRTEGPVTLPDSTTVYSQIKTIQFYLPETRVLQTKAKQHQQYVEKVKSSQTTV